MALFFHLKDMSHHFSTIDGTEVSCASRPALYFPNLYPELRLYRTHFYYNKEYLNVYLGLRGRPVELELDVYEYYNKLNIVNGQFKETVRATLAPQYKQWLVPAQPTFKKKAWLVKPC
ncbi:hypothetical protein M9H77_20703 [Catharanthus roseus]|uniref:Uncharacterized protein n=1 Tax=Catharanthus roseus TaxID=4058 RepID=A0ACC0ALX9_CATRO|nr:hypothetical protein M9H77_20703 [Catharanthus roseus]